MFKINYIDNKIAYVMIMQRSENWYVTKKKYNAKNDELWKEYRKDYPDYMSDWGLLGVDNLIEFIKGEWGLSGEEEELFKEFDKNDKIERLVLDAGKWRYDI